MSRAKKEFDIENYLKTEQEKINRALRRYLPSVNGKPSELHYAIDYSVMRGGKRLRPILAITSFRWAGGKGKLIIPVACAIEFIHAFSLIHDDLPTIDNDDFRHNKPTTHKELERMTNDSRLGEAIALLSGDALLSLAFKLLTRAKNIRVIDEVASAAFELVRGEAADILAEGKDIDTDELEFIHLNKTAALIKTSLRVGAIMANANRKLLNAITKYGTYLGLAFQIRDDYLDEVATEKELGKPVGSDERLKKATYTRKFGLERTQEIAAKYIEMAKNSLPKNRDNTILFAIADYVITRTK